MLKYLLLGFVLILLICLIYWVIRNTDAVRRKDSEAFLQESVGIFDDGARRALDRLTQINAPRARDYFRRGEIVQHNILEGNIGGRADEPRAARTRRRAAVGNIVRDYTDALLDLRNHPPANDAIGAEFMINTMEGFGALQAEDAVVAEMLAGFAGAFNAAAPVVRQDTVKTRVAAAVATTETRAGAVNKTFDDATKYTSDGQNVHDGKVNADLKETFRRIKMTAGPDFDAAASIAEAREYIRKDYQHDDLNKANVKNAISGLNKAAEGGYISTFGDNEDKIFAYTWDRCKHPRNRENRSLMKDAVITSLADGTEKGTQVCINGRCGRILNSLVTLDFDREVSTGSLTMEAYRNQIFQETKTIINQEIDRAQASNDPILKAVGDAYETGDDSGDAAADEKFKSELKSEIDRNLGNYTAKLSNSELSNIRQECYAYATL